MIVPEVIRSRRRTLSLELCEDGRLLLRAPQREKQAPDGRRKG
jgi:hypothetical protein